ncbi:hypothetical protein QMS86_22110, partial [Cronobacter dublinensis]|uniref:hypothetical protein n=1 Tax=Cronobacter dublinensis TaxID=413497 RepID=UPI003AE59245
SKLAALPTFFKRGRCISNKDKKSYTLFQYMSVPESLTPCRAGPAIPGAKRLRNRLAQDQKTLKIFLIKRRFPDRFQRLAQRVQMK